jgi:hypothetical protein
MRDRNVTRADLPLAFWMLVGWALIVAAVTCGCANAVGAPRCTEDGCYDAHPNRNGECPKRTHLDVQYGDAPHPGEFTRPYCHRNRHPHPHPGGLVCVANHDGGAP